MAKSHLQRLSIACAITCALLMACTAKNENKTTTAVARPATPDIIGSVQIDSVHITLTRAPKPDLPMGISSILDSVFPGWVFMSHQDVNNPAFPNQRFERFEFYPCDLNGDSVTDYAMAIVAGKDTGRAEWFLAFTSKGSTFQLFRLAEFKASLGIVGGSELRLQRKGEGIPDFSKWKETENDEAEMDSITTIFKTDALTLMPLNGCCPSTFIFENGHFREFDSGD